MLESPPGLRGGHKPGWILTWGWQTSSRLWPSSKTCEVEVDTLTPEFGGSGWRKGAQWPPGALWAAPAPRRPKPLISHSVSLRPSVPQLGPVGEAGRSDVPGEDRHAPQLTRFLLFSLRWKDRQTEVPPQAVPWAPSEARSASQTNKYIEQSSGRQRGRQPCSRSHPSVNEQEGVGVSGRAGAGQGSREKVSSCP